MGNENPYTGVGRMNVCNYLSNIALLGGLKGEDLSLWNNKDRDVLWLVSSQKIKKSILLIFEKFTKFKVLDFTFYLPPLEDIYNLRYYYNFFGEQYIMSIIFLGEKVS
jgi:hypothetical protein